jgi:hypothetical protein
MASHSDNELGSRAQKYLSRFADRNAHAVSNILKGVSR